MPALKTLLALAAIAVVALSSAPLHANALAADRAQVARHAHAHDAVARRKRSDGSSQCKPRPSSSLPPPPTSTPPPPPPPTSTPTPTPTPPATTSAPSATPTSSSNAGAKKWGLAWGADPADLPNFAYLPKVGYVYNWSPISPDDRHGLEYMAMLWGYDQIGDFQNKVVAGYANYAMGPNEPNEPSQSNISPTDAVNLWMKYINYLKDEGYYLISPACTDDDAGLAWYQQFFQACNNAGCHIDGVAFHAYTNSAQHLIDYATTLHNTYGRDVWITEFADQNFSPVGGEPSMDDVWNYAGQVSNFVNNTPWIRAAFPFGALSDLQGVDQFNSLLAGNGYPTDLGYYYFG